MTATFLSFSTGVSFFAESEPKGHQLEPLSLAATAGAVAVLVTGGVVLLSADLAATVAVLSAGVDAWSDEPNCHHLWPPSASFCGVCAQPVIARHRARARVLLDDIEYPHNELRIKRH